MTIQESDEPDDDEGVEVLSSGSWTTVSPLATLWGTNAVLAERPDWATAASFLTKAMERHRAAADAYAKALLSDADIGDLNHTTVALEETIVSLGLARAMLSEWEPAGLAEHRRETFSDDEEPDWILPDDEPSIGTTPPDFELPVTVSLGVDLGDDHVTVRLRDARVFSSGILVTVDLLARRPAGMTTGERQALEERFHDVVHGTDSNPDQEPADVATDAQFLSGNVIAYTRAAVAWCEYWVETRDSAGSIEFTIQDPLSPGVGRRSVSLDAELIASARSRVVSAAEQA